MNGVVFQISDRQTTKRAEPRSPNQSRVRPSHGLTKPLSAANAYCHA